MTSVAFTTPARLPSPLYLARRDFVVHGGDDVTLELTVVETDGGAAVNVTGAEITFRATRLGTSDIVVSKAGTIVSAAAGRINLALTGEETAQLSGSYDWNGVVVLTDRTITQRGVMQVRTQLGEPVSGDYMLTETGDYILVE